MLLSHLGLEAIALHACGSCTGQAPPGGMISSRFCRPLGNSIAPRSLDGVGEVRGTASDCEPGVGQWLPLCGPQALDRFKREPNGVLVATDVAARGLDVPGIRCVVRAPLPKPCEHAWPLSTMDSPAHCSRTGCQ